MSIVVTLVGENTVVLTYQPGSLEDNSLCVTHHPTK